MADAEEHAAGFDFVDLAVDGALEADGRNARAFGTDYFINDTVPARADLGIVEGGDPA